MGGSLKLGVAAIAFGLLLDLSVHSMAPAAHAGAPFGAEEHLAHLMVLVGMVILLVGVIADGMRLAGRERRPEGSPRDAVR
jgi:hypothetical protein